MQVDEYQVLKYQYLPSNSAIRIIADSTQKINKLFMHKINKNMQNKKDESTILLTASTNKFSWLTNIYYLIHRFLYFKFIFNLLLLIC